MIRPIAAGDAVALESAYNALGAASKRTFHPLGDQTTAEACEAIIAENAPETGRKFDMVAVSNGRIVGWSFLWNLSSGCPTFGLGIMDEWQGKGLGRRLMDYVLAEAIRRGIPKISLTVVQDNDRARGMYERRGFVRQESFLGDDGLPYYYMTLELPIQKREEAT